ncbi:MAG: hypothetical protein II663_00595 [Bacteroidales bacterium]|nr:hypothetical protein [Bacteroidales bacterium]
MSYKEKPLLRLYKYENGFEQIAIIDDYEDASFERNLYSAGQFTITINRNIPNAMYFEKGIFVQFGNDPYDFGEINDVTKNVDERGKGGETLSITGYDSRYILKRRIIRNMNDNGKWSMTSTGEICLRSIIRDQCGANAEAKRRLPIFNTIPSGQNSVGQMYSVSEEYNNLYDVCVEIATQSETGWRFKFDSGSLTMECYSGRNLTNEVNFGTEFNSMRDGQLVDSFDSFTNAVYVGGKGQNDDRDIYEGENAIDGNPPSGLDRFECWDDQSEMTVQSEYEAEAMSMLNQYGQTLTLNGNGLAKCPYIYKEQYDVGDTVSMEMDGKKFHTKILAVTEHWTKGNYDLNFSFGKPVSTLSSQLHLMLRQIQKASNKDTSTDSVRWYTIPTDTEMPKSDVTFRTIGFIGNVGSGATFRLYLDNEKTGAKTYHIYFKQLGGSGKLTLTTGVAGASNLTMNVGSYVMIVYVDEFGNVSMQGSGTTNTVQSGNTQPVTSGGVYNAIGTSDGTVTRNPANTTRIDEIFVRRFNKMVMFHCVLIGCQLVQGEIITFATVSEEFRPSSSLYWTLVDIDFAVEGLRAWVTDSGEIQVLSPQTVTTNLRLQSVYFTD